MPESNLDAVSEDKKEKTPLPSDSSWRRLFARRTIFIFSIGAILVCSAGAAVLFYIYSHQKGAEISNHPSAPESDWNILERPVFAQYSYDLSNFTASVPDYDLGSDMENIVNLNRFGFSAEMKQQLETSKFIVVQTDQEHNGGTEEFFQGYRTNKTQDIPSFVTVDSALHTYHLAYDDALKTLEQSAFYEEVRAVSEYLYEESEVQYDYFVDSGDTDFADAAKRNVAYFGVALTLLGEDVEVPAYASELVNYEVDAVGEHLNILCSMAMDLTLGTSPTCYEEDYTQYVPRGHYTRSKRLENYFKAMMWYGRMTFRQKSDSETRSALLLTYALSVDDAMYASWSDVYDATTFMIGSSDDLSVYEYGRVLDDLYTNVTDVSDLTGSSEFSQFEADVAKLRAPSINSMIVWDDENVDEETKGFRVMGQRYVLDADVFQQLMYPEVSRNDTGEKRNMPKSLDVLAAMGFEDAEELLTEEGDFAYPQYGENLEAMKEKISSYDEQDWTQNLYYGWLYMLKPLTEPVASGYPAFMNDSLWTYKNMNSYLGSWTELKHDTMLYSKQPYGGAGAGGSTFVDLDDRGYVEPQPVLYARLEALAKMTKEGLQDRGLMDMVDYQFSEGSGPACGSAEAYSSDTCTRTFTFTSEALEENLGAIEDMAKTLKLISVKELTNQSLSGDDVTYIREYGTLLADIWTATFHEGEIDEWAMLDKNPVMLVSDVATDPDAASPTHGVLEEGLGKLMTIYVIIPAPGGSSDYYRVARGSVWSHYEFIQPLSDRLTDESWKEQVRAGDLPDLSDWKMEYIFGDSYVVTKSAPQTYSDSGIPNPQEDCVQQGGTYEACGNVCLEFEPDCNKPCEPICRFY